MTVALHRTLPVSMDARKRRRGIDAAERPWEPVDNIVEADDRSTLALAA